ncbi:MAG: hypothetical protein ACI9WS_002269 [Paraglaciecola psychrophila]|jgi:hypothetical protein
MNNALALAQHYFDLSNERNLVAIEALFTASSTYSSTNTGIYLGGDAIMTMQRGFFASFETMNWSIQKVEEVKAGIVLFDFTFTGKTLTGEQTVFGGQEYVVVFNQKIQHIEVKT